MFANGLLTLLLSSVLSLYFSSFFQFPLFSLSFSPSLFSFFLKNDRKTRRLVDGGAADVSQAVKGAENDPLRPQVREGTYILKWFMNNILAGLLGVISSHSTEMMCIHLIALPHKCLCASLDESSKYLPHLLPSPPLFSPLLFLLLVAAGNTADDRGGGGGGKGAHFFSGERREKSAIFLD